MAVRLNVVPRILTVGEPKSERALKLTMYFLFAIKDTGLIDDTLAAPEAVRVNPYSGPFEKLTFPPEKPVAKNVGA